VDVLVLTWSLSMKRNTMESPSQAERRDNGLATSFLVDPFMEHLSSDEKAHEAPSRFTLVIAAGWDPDDDSLSKAYRDFTDRVKACFKPADFQASDGSFPAVCLYPLKSLHITVATMQSFELDTENEEARQRLYNEWKRLLERAASKPLWPSKSLETKLKSAQIASKNGILLWEEKTGGLQAMRKCIAQEIEEHTATLVAAGLDVSTLSVPTITHSTFLRFAHIPKTCASNAQSRFQATVLSSLERIFSDMYVVDTIKLACEKRPYMDIPNAGAISINSSEQ